jgi:hypothetical protein
MLLWTLPAQAAPTPTGAPVVGKQPHSTKLTCSQGSWDAGSKTLTYTYTWIYNGSALPDSNSPTTEATNAGEYSCEVTASDGEGSATQASAKLEINPASVDLTLVKHKLRVRAGGKAILKLKGVNSGSFPQYGVSVCVKGPRRSRRALRLPKCREIESFESESTQIEKFVVRPRPWARGPYPIRFAVKVRSYELNKPFRAKLIVRPR